jgi:hypothetical protein
MFDWKKIIAGAVAGFCAAAIVDVRKWANWPKGTPFDWGEAFRTWVAGAATGAAAALGISGV